MTHRETWEEVSFQVFTDEDGVLRSGYYPTGEGLVTGNVQVDRVWGNMPLQPDEDRSYNEFSFGGGSGDHGWDNTWQYSSDTLQTGNYGNNDSVQWLFDIYPQTPADSHIIATTGYSNFPGYLPNYAGDGDTGLETVIPQIMRKTNAQADYLLGEANLNLRANAHNPTINYIESTGTTVRVWAYDTNAAGGGYPQAYLVGIKPGDKLFPDNNLQGFGLVTVTAVNEDGENSWIEFETETALNLDDFATGTIWAGPDLVNVITVIRSWNLEGAIVDENRNIYVRYLGD
jgi:hypothetical protein